MQYRSLSTTGIQVSEICFGCWQLGSLETYGGSEPEGVRAIEAALELGINFFDTADVYSDGLSEQRLGAALRGRRHQAVIATKVGGDGNCKPDHIRSAIDRSLRRLGTDFVDLYQIHWPDPKTPIEDSWAAMVEVWRSGKARAIGVSNFAPDQVRRCLSVGPVHTHQPPYHMFNREVEDGLLALCREQEISLIPYGPQAHGLLSGKHRKGMGRPAYWDTDWRRHHPFFHGESYERHMDAVEALVGIAERQGLTLGQLAIAWVLRLPEVAAPITGPRTAEHIREHAGASGVTLSDAVTAEIEAVLGRLKG